jgi:hypothetical protein
MVGITEIEGIYTLENCPYSMDKYAKNYAARIEGFISSCVLKRMFLSAGKEPGQFIIPHKPEVGDIFELRTVLRVDGKYTRNSRDVYYRVFSYDVVLPISKQEVFAYLFEKEKAKNQTGLII